MIEDKIKLKLFFVVIDSAIVMVLKNIPNIKFFGNIFLNNLDAFFLSNIRLIEGAIHAEKKNI